MGAWEPNPPPSPCNCSVHKAGGREGGRGDNLLDPTTSWPQTVESNPTGTWYYPQLHMDMACVQLGVREGGNWMWGQEHLRIKGELDGGWAMPMQDWEDSWGLTGLQPSPGRREGSEMSETAWVDLICIGTGDMGACGWQGQGLGCGSSN